MVKSAECNDIKENLCTVVIIT